MALDPYRVLGLLPGSSAADVKRAYRRLAKANHPDSAGESALPRFLEIQRAYETLTTVPWRPGQRRPAPSAPPSEPWRADPTRARSTSGAQRPGGDAGGTGGARASASGARQSTGAPGSSRSGERPADRAGTAPGGTAPGGTAPPGAAAGRTPPRGGASGAGPPPGGRTRPPRDGARGPRDGARPPGSSGRRRTATKATFGSTTYDEAKDSADTTWSGASWYGPSSGEYWRVNPREYADPRKHGPEYLAKAAARAAAAAERRARQEAASAPESDPEGPDEPQAQADAAGRPPRRPAWTAYPRDGHGPDAGPAASSAAAAASSAAAPGYGGSDVAGGSFLDGFSLPVLNPGPGVRRLLRALIAWPPLGVAAAAAIGEATGCAAFEASCAAPAELYPWLAQAAIILVLLTIPRIARILAGGTIAVVLLAFPVSAVLTAGGANYDRTYGPAALISLLAIAWAIGVGAVLLRRALTRAIP